jgi:hypothetical protein
MSDYYEHISRETLRRRASTTKFPLDILDFTCNMYGCQRLLTMGEAVVQMGHPTLGVVAGCTSATYHVQSYAGPPLEAFVLRHPQVDLNLHVDDPATYTEANSKEVVVHRLREAAADLLQVVNFELGCQISVKKAAVAASDEDLHRKVGRALGEFGRYNQLAAGRLGISFSAGKRRRAFIQSNILTNRVTAVGRRRKRLARIRAASKKAAQAMFSKRMLPAAVYGAEVGGLRQHLCKEATRSAAGCPWAIWRWQVSICSPPPC